ncbi:DNA methyltransferase [Roseinatronobacter sp. NSM]
MDEVFGEENWISDIILTKTPGLTAEYIASTSDYIIWYSKRKPNLKYRALFTEKGFGGEGSKKYDKAVDSSYLPYALSSEQRSGVQTVPDSIRVFRHGDLTSQRQGRDNSEAGAMSFQYARNGVSFRPARGRGWSTTKTNMDRLLFADRIDITGKNLSYRRFLKDFAAFPKTNIWDDIGGIQSRADPKVYVVQTAVETVKRCLLMATDPGDLVLDPTCGSGTTAYVAEQWGRRWITIDTSRVALALARARIMGAKYPWYILADSPEGQRKEAEVTRASPATHPTYNDIRHGFVYDRVPHITLKSIANNTEIDTIWDNLQPAVEGARAALNAALSGHPAPFEVQTGGRKGVEIDFTATGEVELPSGEMAPANGFMEWEIPRDAPDDWPAAAKDALAQFWEARIARQREIDASIAAKAEFEFLYDKPFEDKKRIRVAGPFTVESLSPHRTQAVNEYGELIDEHDAAQGKRQGATEAENYRAAMLENLSKAGVQQSGRDDAIKFTSLVPWAGDWISAEARYMEGEVERRAGIFIGPEYGTVQRADLVACAREAADAGFDIVIACAFNFDAHTAEFRKLGRLPILQARMNPDLHMAGDLKAGGGNLFVVFGEPDIELREEGGMYRVELRGVDIFKPATGQVVASEPDDIACWFIDTDYNEESFFVRHAYFPGAEVPYKQLQTTLKGEVDQEAWDSLKRTVSRPFARPKSGRIAVKVINHLGDEVMKVMGVL